MDRPRCTARSKRSGERCKNAPRRGATVCSMHGGSAPQVAAKARARVAEQAARKAFGRLVDVSTPVDNPLTALAELAGHVTAWMTFLADRIAKMEKLAYSRFDAGEQIKGEIVLFERAMDRCNTVLGTVARLNIDERLARITEQQADLVAGALGAALADLGLSLEQQREARRGFARHLRVVAG